MRFRWLGKERSACLLQRPCVTEFSERPSRLLCAFLQPSCNARVHILSRSRNRDRDRTRRRTQVDKYLRYDGVAAPVAVAGKRTASIFEREGEESRGDRILAYWVTGQRRSRERFGEGEHLTGCSSAHGWVEARACGPVRSGGARLSLVCPIPVAACMIVHVQRRLLESHTA